MIFIDMDKVKAQMAELDKVDLGTASAAAKVLKQYDLAWEASPEGLAAKAELEKLKGGK